MIFYSNEIIFVLKWSSQQPIQGKKRLRNNSTTNSTTLQAESSFIDRNLRQKTNLGLLLHLARSREAPGWWGKIRFSFAIQIQSGLNSNSCARSTTPSAPSAQPPLLARRGNHSDLLEEFISSVRRRTRCEGLPVDDDREVVEPHSGRFEKSQDNSQFHHVGNERI